jgi:hypothetical protein
VGKSDARRTFNTKGSLGNVPQKLKKKYFLKKINNKMDQKSEI